MRRVLDVESYAGQKPPYFKDTEELIVVNAQLMTAWEDLKSISQILESTINSVEIKVDPVGPSRAFSPYLRLIAEMEDSRKRSLEHIENRWKKKK